MSIFFCHTTRLIGRNIVNLGFKHSPEGPIERVHVRCAQALGSFVFPMSRTRRTHPNIRPRYLYRKFWRWHFSLFIADWRCRQGSRICQVSCYPCWVVLHIQLQSYTLVSRKTISVDKPVDEIVLIPSLSRALVLSGTALDCYMFTRSHSILLFRQPITFSLDSFSWSLAHQAHPARCCFCGGRSSSKKATGFSSSCKGDAARRSSRFLCS